MEKCWKTRKKEVGRNSITWAGKLRSRWSPSIAWFCVHECVSVLSAYSYVSNYKWYFDWHIHRIHSNIIPCLLVKQMKLDKWLHLMCVWKQLLLFNSNNNNKNQNMHVAHCTRTPQIPNNWFSGRIFEKQFFGNKQNQFRFHYQVKCYKKVKNTRLHWPEINSKAIWWTKRRMKTKNAPHLHAFLFVICILSGCLLMHTRNCSKIANH